MNVDMEARIIKGDKDFKNGIFYKNDRILNKIKKDEFEFFTKYYTPDVILSLGEREICILEHSTTSDRKVHIGELLQAYEFCTRNALQGSFNLVLDGESKSPPKPNFEKERLQHYYLFLEEYLSKEYNCNLEIYVSSKDEFLEKGINGITWRRE